MNWSEFYQSLDAGDIAPVYLFTGGPAFAVSWWLSGIPFDLFHCAGNFFMALVLFRPLRTLLQRMYQRLSQ